MNVLAIDTVSSWGSVALSYRGAVTSRIETTYREHAKQLLPMVDDLLNQVGATLVECEGIALDIGPGSFTGVRIGMSAAKALAFALSCPILPVCSLQALAWQAWRLTGETRIFAALDARMGEVYWAVYRASEAGLETVVAPSLSEPEVIVPPESCYGFGNVAELVPAEGMTWHPEPAYPLAEDILALGQQQEGVAPEMVEPLYLRNKVVS